MTRRLVAIDCLLARLVEVRKTCLLLHNTQLLDPSWFASSVFSLLFASNVLVCVCFGGLLVNIVVSIYICIVTYKNVCVYINYICNLMAKSNTIGPLYLYLCCFYWLDIVDCMWSRRCVSKQFGREFIVAMAIPVNRCRCRCRCRIRQYIVSTTMYPQLASKHQATNCNSLKLAYKRCTLSQFVCIQADVISWNFEARKYINWASFIVYEKIADWMQLKGWFDLQV